MTLVCVECVVFSESFEDAGVVAGLSHRVLQFPSHWVKLKEDV